MASHQELNDKIVRRSDMAVDITNHHYIVLSFLHDWMVQVARPAAHGRLLDYGCGGQPYRALLEPCVESYITADVATYGGLPIDIILQPDQPVPLPDASIDTILSTQALEHVPDPAFYIRECSRLLVPGGTLILTAPMQWRHHEVPYDFFRYTRFGLERLVNDAGMRMEVTASTGGVFALMGQILLNHLSEKKLHRPRAYAFINRVALWLDRRYPDSEDVINWMCIAIKESEEPRHAGASTR